MWGLCRQQKDFNSTVSSLWLMCLNEPQTGRCFKLADLEVKKKKKQQTNPQVKKETLILLRMNILGVRSKKNVIGNC